MISSLFALLFIGLLPAALTFVCSNHTLTSAGSPYNFGLPGTVNSYNGTYSCTWTVKVPYMFYALLTTDSQLSSNDSVTILYPGGDRNQLHNSHPQNTFWLPEGDSQIQFSAKANGSLSFSLQWNKIDLSQSPFNITVDPQYYPAAIRINQFAVTTFNFRASAGSKSVAIGVAGQVVNATANNPHPLRSCFLFNGVDQARVFTTTLDTVYPNVMRFGPVVSIFCLANKVFDGYAIVQTGEPTAKYTIYTVAVVGNSNSSFTLSAVVDEVSAVTVVTENAQMHSDVTSLALSSNSTIMIITDGGANNDVVATFTQSNATIPYESRSFSTTFSVTKGNAQFSMHAHSNIPDGANCPSLQTITSANSPYTFYNETNPVAYWGPFSCDWIVYVKVDEYAVVETSGQLADADVFAILYPGSAESRVLHNDHPNEKIYLPPGSSSVLFSAAFKGTFQMKITWRKNSKLDKINVKVASNGSVVLTDSPKLDNQMIYINSDDDKPIGIALATLPINASVHHPFESCFVMDQLTQVFQNTLDNALGKVIYINANSYINCVDSVPCTPGYLVAASSKVLQYAEYFVSYLTTNKQIISMGNTNNFMTIVETNQYHTDILNITFTTPNSIVTISDGSFSNSISYNKNNISYPVETDSQINIFSVVNGNATAVVLAHSKFVTMNVLSPMILLAVIISLI